MRIGVIGAGWFASAVHIPAIANRSDVRLEAVCRLGRPVLDTIKETFGFAFATEDYRELLERDLDAVIVGSQNHLHYEHARAAIDRGLHVLCDKPMTLRPDHAWDLVRAAEARGVHLVVGYGWNYKPMMEIARDLMSEEHIGARQYVLCHMASPTRDVFIGTKGRERWREALVQPDRATWQDPDKGGGYAHGQLTHALGLAFWLNPLRAKSVQARVMRADAPADLYDAGIVTFEDGSLGTLSGAATLPDDQRFQVDIRVFGSEGAVTMDLDRERLVLHRHDGRHKEIDVPQGTWTYSCEAPANALVDLALGRGENRTPGELGARVVETIHALHTSARQDGRPVKVGA